MSARLRGLNPYELHKYLVNSYLLDRPGATCSLARDTSRDRTDLDVIRQHHKFLWEEADDADTWEKQLAKKYYDKLFKEYCICDLSRYKENKVALRWRIEKEVVIGKGQFQCGNKTCNKDKELRSWEVNFAYKEDDERKNALVKVRLCPDCSTKLNYKSKKHEVKRLKRNRNKKKKSRKGRTRETSEGGEESSEATQSSNEVQSTSQTVPEDSSLWKKGVQELEEKSREEEFEEYLEDLLL